MQTRPRAGSLESDLLCRDVTINMRQKRRADSLLSTDSGTSLFSQSSVDVRNSGSPSGVDREGNHFVDDVTRVKHVINTRPAEKLQHPDSIVLDNSADEEGYTSDGIVEDSDEEEGEDTVDGVRQEETTTVRRMRLVKQYAHLKEELTRSAARSLAGKLYQDGLLCPGHLESICQSTWRREAVEQLLKRVLIGSPKMYHRFIVALREHDEESIANTLEATHLTEAEKAAFIGLEQMAHGKGPRPDSHEVRLRLTESDCETLTYYLNNRNFIDPVNDHCLSSFHFSIREHTNICQCGLDSERRVKELILTMKKCSDKIFDVLSRTLSSLEMEHVIRKLERKRQSATKRKSSHARDPEEPSTSTGSKRQRVDSTVEHRLVTSMQRSSSLLRLHLSDNLDFELENINKGSIVIQLCPKSTDSWKKLEENCRSGKIKDFIPIIYNNESVEDMLQEGEYRLQFTIYTLPVVPSSESGQSPQVVSPSKKAMFHLETKQEVPPVPDQKPGSHDNAIVDHMDLLAEELEISKDLLKILVREKLVDDNIKEQLNEQGSRAKKIKYLLNKLSCHGNKGYQVLLDYLEEENEALYKELKTRDEVKVIDTKLDTAAKVGKKSRSSSGTHRSIYSKETFFTGTVVLKVKKPAGGSKKENQDPSRQHGGLEISCPEIINPVCHFKPEDGESIKVKDTGAVTMVLEEAWEPVGFGAGQKQREILVGKRKKKKDASSTDVPQKRPLKRKEDREPDDDQGPQDLSPSPGKSSDCEKQSGSSNSVKSDDPDEDAEKDSEAEEEKDQT